MGGLILIAVLWMLSPLALIPAVIVLSIQCKKLNEKVRGQHASPVQQTRPVQQTQPVQQTHPAQIQSAQVYRAPENSVSANPAPVYRPEVNAVAGQKPAGRTSLTPLQIVFGIGVILVLTAGLIFATTTWRLLPAFAKVALLFAAVLLFFLCAFLLEKKAHLRQTSLTFYVLGSLFLPLVVVAVGYFRWLGSFFSFFGEGRCLLAFVSLFLLSILLGAGYFFYHVKVFSLLSKISMAVSFLFLFRQIAKGSVFTLLCLCLFLFCHFLRIKGNYVLRTHIVDWMLAVLLFVRALYVCVQAAVIGGDSFVIKELWLQLPTWGIVLCTAGVLFFLACKKRTVESHISAHSFSCALAVIGMPALYAVAVQLIWVDFDVRMLLPMLILAIAAAVAMLVFSLRKRKPFEAGLLMICLYITMFAGAFICMLASLSGIERGLAETIGLLLVIVLVHTIYRKERNNTFGFVTVLLFVFSIMPAFWRAALTFTGEIEPLIVRCSNQLNLMAVLMLLLLGLKMYPNLLNRYCLEDGKKTKGWLIDWNFITSGIMIVVVMMQNLLHRDHAANLWMYVWLVLAVYLAYAAAKSGSVNGMAKRCLLTVSGACVCFAWMTQSFFTWPWVCKSECQAVILLPFAFYLYHFIWKGKEKIVAWVAYALFTICLLVQYHGAAEAGAEIHSYKMVFFFLSICLLLFAAWKSKKVRYLLLCSFMLMPAAFQSADFSDIWEVAAVAVLCVLLTILMYRENNTAAAVIPVLLYEYLIASMIDYIELPKVVENSLWIAVFAAAVLLGRFLHAKTVEKVAGKIRIDWFGLLSITVPVLLLFDGNDKWRFIGLLLLISYVLNFYKRVGDDSTSGSVHSGILTASLFLTAVAWCSQPFFELPLVLRTEWKMAAWIVFLFILYKWVWKAQKTVMSWILFAGAACCVCIQGLDAVLHQRLVDVMILGVVVLLLLVYAFLAKSKRWFLLSSITLTALVIYLSRDFWQSLAWWIYLLAAGVLLIYLAASGEYRKKYEKKENKVKQYFQEWEW